MPEYSDDIRQGLSVIIQNYKENETQFDNLQRKYIEGRIKVFKTILKNPNTNYYFDENGEIQLGNIIWDNCRYCNRKLENIRNAEYPKLRGRNAERFCSKSCTTQFSKMKKKVDAFGADLVIWGKDFVKIIFHHKCSNANIKKPHWPLSFELRIRSTRSRNFNG
jgi:hypothetical protein